MGKGLIIGKKTIILTKPTKQFARVSRSDPIKPSKTTLQICSLFVVAPSPFPTRGSSFSADSMANPLYGSGPLRSREGITARPATGSDEIQLRIDPMHADLDEEITGLHRKIRQLKGVAQEIESEAKFQNDFISQLQMTLIKAQAGVKNNMRRMNKSIIQQGSNHLFHVIMFALLCFFVVYLWAKFSRR